MIKNLYLYDLDIKHLKLFNKIFKSEKKGYINYLTKIFQKQSDFKIISPFFSRNSNFNCVYPLICKTKLLKTILKNKKNIQYKIWSNNYTEYVHLKQNFRDEFFFFKANVFEKIFFFIKPYIAIILRFFYLSYFLFFEISNRSEKRKKLIKQYKNVILIDTTLMKSSFSNKKNIFFDRFYGDICKKNVKNSNFFLAPENLLFNETKKYLKIIDKEKINFIFRFDFLNISDYLKALKIVGLENLNFSKKFYQYQSIKLNYPIFIDKINSKFNFNYYVGVLNYFFFKKLFENKVKLKTIINWNENQSADKGFVLGARKFFQKIPLKGFACYFVNYDYYFDKQPLQCEFKKKLIPNNLFVPTKLNGKKIKKFCKSVKIYEAPLLRFKSLFNINTASNNKNKKSILVFLPIERKEAIHIIIQLSKSNFIKKNKIKVIVKTHPDMDNKFKNKLLKICEYRFIFSNEPLTKVIKNSNLVISTSSSTSLETIFYGKPLICPINSNLLIDTPIVDIVEKKHYDISFNAEDLEKKIMDHLLGKKNYNINVLKVKKKILKQKEQKKYLNLIS